MSEWNGQSYVPQLLAFYYVRDAAELFPYGVLWLKQNSKLEELESEVDELKLVKDKLQVRVKNLTSELINFTSRKNASEPQVQYPDPKELVSGGELSVLLSSS